VFQLGEQEIGQPADHGASATRLIEHRLECDRVDLLPVQHSLELPAEERSRQSKIEKIETALQVAGCQAGSRLDAIDQSRLGIANYRFVRPRKGQPARTSLDHRDCKTIDPGRPYRRLFRTVVGIPRQAQRTKFRH
jgi:hypothetical protein